MKLIPNEENRLAAHSESYRMWVDEQSLDFASDDFDRYLDRKFSETDRLIAKQKQELDALAVELGADAAIDITAEVDRARLEALGKAFDGITAVAPVVDIDPTVIDLTDGAA